MMGMVVVAVVAVVHGERLVLRSCSHGGMTFGF